MEPWLKTINKFLKNWEDKDYFEGAIVCGSAVNGTATKNSDIDLHIILSDKIKWRERGNTIVDGILIEYFANPIKQHEKYYSVQAKEGRRANARMIATGKVISDRSGHVAKMQMRARTIMQQKFKAVGGIDLENLKYFLWDDLDNLKGLYLEKSPNFTFFYYLVLGNIIKSYAKFLGLELPPLSKIFRYLNDQKFPKKYSIQPLKDKQFIKLVDSCLLGSGLVTIEKLAAYVLNKMGGFIINGWKIRTKAEV
ncbi:MAG TPA: nucleotidyltransferase domain-containing protein [Patescibacteria group bacterium]|nr:nucleotidyltransferase domain-containing protein [Patescibacteria group bacterium]